MAENQVQTPPAEKVIALSASLLEPFQGHPFQVASGEEMEQLKESIREYGVLSPLLVRPRGDGRYEIVSGHRRKAACEALGITELPVLVRDMTDDEAVILMVDSNIQREHILPSEKAFAYKMKMEAVKHQGRTMAEATCGQLGHKSRDSLSQTESGRTVQRYIRLLQGDPGCGKTMAVLSLAALLSKGESLPFEEAAREPINILYQTSEDGIADTIKPRLESAGANCTRIKIINEEKRALTFDDPRLEQSILQEDARLLILDPLSAYIGPTVSMNQANEVRGAFRSLYAMAQRTKCAVVIVAHMNKMSGISALYRTSGSIDIAGAVRSILTVTRYQHSPTQRVLVPVKSNLAAAGPALLFELSDHVEWLRQLEEDADQLLSGCDSLPEAPTKQQQVEEELPRLLEKGPVANQEIIQHFKNKGIQDRTVNLVKGRLNIRSVRKGDKWYWQLNA